MSAQETDGEIQEHEVLDENETAIDITVSDFTVQYIFKDLLLDRASPQPIRHYSARMKVAVPSVIVPYIETYIKNRGIAAELEEGKDPCPYPYNLPTELRKKWKKWLKSEYPDFIVENNEPVAPGQKVRRREMDSDEIAAAVISCTLEDTLADSLEYCWDNVLGPKFKDAIPVPPDGYKIGSRYIHLISWKPEMGG